MVRPVVRLLNSTTVTKLLRPLHGDAISIFVIHRARNEAEGIGGHTAADLKALIKRLAARNVNFLGLDDLLRLLERPEPLPGYNVMFTMDDGYADQYRLAREVFVASGVPLTIFPIVGFLDGEVTPWDARVSHAVRHAKGSRLEFSFCGQRASYELGNTESRRGVSHQINSVLKQLRPDQIAQTVESLERAAGFPDGALKERPAAYAPMTWEQLRELSHSGVAVGSHSYSHWIMGRADDATVTRELEISFRRLQEEGCNPRPALAWPIGRLCDFTPRQEELAAAAGYKLGFALTGDYAIREKLSGRPFRVDRLGLPPDVEDAVAHVLLLGRVKNRLLKRHSVLGSCAKSKATLP